MSVSRLAKGNHIIVMYKYVEDILARREPFREAHLNHWTGYLTKGLAGAGPYLNPTDFGIYFFQTENRDMVNDAVSNDPYMTAGLIQSHEIREMNVTIAQD